MIFDTGQPHGVIARGSSGFAPADFPAGQDDAQVFLTWELPIEEAPVGHALDIDPATALRLDEEQVWFKGAPTRAGRPHFSRSRRTCSDLGIQAGFSN